MLVRNKDSHQCCANRINCLGSFIGQKDQRQKTARCIHPHWSHDIRPGHELGVLSARVYGVSHEGDHGIDDADDGWQAQGE